MVNNGGKLRLNNEITIFSYTLIPLDGRMEERKVGRNGDLAMGRLTERRVTEITKGRM